MARYIRLEVDSDLEWLQRTMDKAVVLVKSDLTRYSNIGEIVFRIADAVYSSVGIEDAAAMGVDPETIEEDREAAEESKPKEKSARYKYNYCSDHPYYGAKRAPHSDCEACWEAYKKLQPLAYNKAWKKFERKNQGR